MRNWITSSLFTIGLMLTGFSLAQASAHATFSTSVANQKTIDQATIDNLNTPAGLTANTDIRLWKSSTPITGDATRFAFQSDRNGNYDIYLMQVNGSHLTRLTQSPADDISPVWSPDGKKIAFVSFRDGDWELYTMNADGSSQTRLTNSARYDGSPAWSPDGSKIIFASERDGNREIYSIDATGSNPQRLTTNTRIDDQPDWAPDGSRIVFISERDNDREIYVMNPDGSTPQRLTNSTGNDEQPSWSPNGNQIAFISMRDDGLIGELYLMNQDGSDPQRLTDNDFYENDPVWSPDGDRIAFSRFLFGQTQSTEDIFTISSFGGFQLQVTNQLGSDSAPAWQPLALNRGPIVYRLTVSNTTSTPALNVSVSDPLPSAVKYFSAIAPDWNCSTPAEGANGTVNCTLAELAGFESKTIEIFGELSTSVGNAVVTNTATATANNDSTLQNNSGTAIRQVTDATDLVLEMISPSQIDAGAEITYTLSISNLSAVAAQGVTIVDSLPNDLSLIACSASGTGSCTASNGIVTATYASLQPAQIETIYLRVRVTNDASHLAQIENKALASSTTLDLNANDNQVSSTTLIVANKRDLRISKVGNLAAVATNSQITYTIQVHNVGPADVTPQMAFARHFTNTQPLAITNCNNTDSNCVSSITVSGLTAPLQKVAVSIFEFSHDTPDAVDLLLVAPDGSKVTLLSDAGGTIDPGVINLTFDDNGVAADDSEPLQDGSYQPTNYGATDPFGTIGTVNDPQPALSRLAQKSNPNGTWKLYAVDDQRIGGAINGGWSIAIVDASAPGEKIVVSDVLPSGVNFVQAAGDGWQISQANGTVNATLFQLNTGITSTFVVTLAAPAQAGWLTTTASVTVPGEINTVNNIATITKWIESPISQFAARSSSPDNVGESTKFTATVSSGSNVIYEWNFGDGSPVITGPTVEHTYALAGNYTTIVTATNSLGIQTVTTAVKIESKQSSVYLPLITR